MNSKVYLFSGKAGHGKDESCRYFQELLEKNNKNVIHTLFAKYIKQYAKDYFGWDGKEETKPRKLLQELGTDIIRNELNRVNFHVDRTIEDIEILSRYFDAFLISDCRFPNEIIRPREKFGDNVVSIRIVRENYESKLTKEQQLHESETALDDFNNFDYTVIAENLDQLYSQLYRIYEIDKS